MVLVVAVPTLVAGMVGTARGSARAMVAWLAAAAYLLYNAVMLLLGTPANQLFLLDVWMLPLAIWAVVAVLHTIDVAAVARRFVQDLAFWLPLMAVAAGWLWRRADWGLVTVPALLGMLVLEGIGVAADQWAGHAADPTSPMVSATAVPVFLVVAAIGLVPVLLLLRHLDRRVDRRRRVDPGSGPPAACGAPGRISWPRS